jgi:G protein-coupled receptor Mth (Methuselah protein)
MLAKLTTDLQNISGKNLFSLSLALLGSYISFIAAMFHGRHIELFKDCPCIALAVVMYYFFMASFFWMLVIAFDVCRALRVSF